MKRKRSADAPPQKLYALTARQARLLRDASDEPGGCYIPLTSGTEYIELIEGGCATMREELQTSDTPTAPGASRMCEWPDRYLVPTAYGLELLARFGK